jgi:hypothetical protein
VCFYLSYACYVSRPSNSPWFELRFRPIHCLNQHRPEADVSYHSVPIHPDSLGSFWFIRNHLIISCKLWSSGLWRHVNFDNHLQRHNPEDRNLHFHPRDNLKSRKVHTLTYRIWVNPHFFDKNLPSKCGVRLMHGIVYPFDDWACDAGIVCCETPGRDR